MSQKKLEKAKSKINFHDEYLKKIKDLKNAKEKEFNKVLFEMKTKKNEI